MAIEGPKAAPDRRICLVPDRILFVSRPHFWVFPGATNRPVTRRHRCVGFGWSGSDFAKEPAFRVQSRPRWLRVVSYMSSRALILCVEDELSVHGVRDLALEGAKRLLLGLALGDLALEVDAAIRGLRIWVMAAMWRAWLSRRFPRRESRCTTRPPEDHSIGAVPL